LSKSFVLIAVFFVELLKKNSAAGKNNTIYQIPEGKDFEKVFVLSKLLG